ncbi:hypothetical protein [Actinoplanes siamensis]|uniref:Uncharacterized protein n=1 Tax=Actinoplanes siamensis TaxID=1223317 RepID=A0A919N6T4_9ACTN|nr:hypothetical protein [Actinoplanes siamensis]GIF05441.1 hypothetical protein Asi03nite_29790 [Actinoplanes siamensis]
MTDRADVYVLPHADPTVCLVADGRRVHDLHVSAVERLGDAVLRRWRDHDAGEPATRAVLAAAAKVLAGFDPSARVAALGAAIALGDPGGTWPVRLWLDDLELVDGTTERPSDILRAAAGVPFTDEVATVLAAATRERPVLWIDRDQQLPALAALAHRLRTPVSLAGGFAGAHWAVLRGWLPAGSDLVDVPVYWRLRTCGGGEARWLTRAAGQAWLDYVSADEVRAAGPASGCVAAILGVTAADATGVITAEGERLDWPALTAFAIALDRRGGRLLVEQMLGAPGETAQSTLGTADRLADADLPWRIAGSRPFHLPAQRDGAAPGWAGRPVTVLPGDAALARGPRFAQADLRAVQPDVTARLRRRGRLAPARVAGAYLRLARDTPAADGPALAPGVVVVTIDGECWLVDLAAVRTLRLDPRIGARLAALPPGAPITSAFTGNTRVAAGVTAMLAGTGVLAGVPHADPGGHR